MKILKTLSLLLITFLIFSTTALSQQFKHVEDLFEIRSAITKQGYQLPEAIKKSSGNNLRTLERIFELNTSALTTIEAYFRIVKIAYAEDGKLNDLEASILNEWLTFIRNQCSYDIEYLEEALTETKDPNISYHINLSKKNIQRLSDVSAVGIRENKMH